DFLLGFMFRFVICNCCRCKKNICRSKCFFTGIKHFLSCLHPYPMNRSIFGLQICRSANQGYFCPSLCGCFSQFKSHFSARMISYKTYGVNGFVCGSGSNCYFFPANGLPAQKWFSIWRNIVYGSAILPSPVKPDASSPDSAGISIFPNDCNREILFFVDGC